MCGNAEREEIPLSLFEDARGVMEEISREADFFEKARKKREPLSSGDYTFAGH